MEASKASSYAAHFAALFAKKVERCQPSLCFTVLSKTTTYMPRPSGQTRALVCGCGALGSVVAETLVRAGVGFVRIVDRDFLELNNLQRQVLYDEQDVADGLPKAIAAANKLRRINSEVQIEPVVADVTHRNIDARSEEHTSELQ